MISLMNARVLAYGAAVGMAVALTPAFAQNAIVPSDFAVTDAQPEPRVVMAPLPPNRSAAARPVRRVALTPVTPSESRIAYVERAAVQRASLTWPLANRPNFLWIGNVY